MEDIRRESLQDLTVQLIEGWMDDLPFYVLYNSVSVISRQWEVDNERLCAVELHSWLRRFRLEWGSNLVP